MEMIKTLFAVMLTAASMAASAADVFQEGPAPDYVVSMEAEHYSQNVPQGGYEWTAVSPAGYSGSGAMEATPNNGAIIEMHYADNSPRLDYKVNFSNPGKYYVWVRGSAATDQDDSLYVGLDGAEVTTSAAITGFALGTDWSWANEISDGLVATLNVASAGTHTINVWMRKDGFVFDKLVLTTNSDAAPVGMGPAESSQVSAATPVASAGGPYGAVLGTAITFDGSSSSDPNDASLTYSWDFGDGGTGTGVSPSHTYAAPGTYTVTLVVSNGSESSSPATANALVVDQTIQSCTSITWDYPADKIQLIDGFRVYVNGAQAGSVQPSEQSVTCSAIGLDKSGLFFVTAAAYNAVGESSQSFPLFVAIATTTLPAPTNLTVH